MNREIADLYNDFRRGALNRRAFMHKLAKIAGGTAAAVAMLPLIENNQAHAQVIEKDDARLLTKDIKYPGQTGDVLAYSARPRGEAKLPAVIVIHENKGLQPHIKDVTRRVALQGYLAIAPDALSPSGGTPDDVDEARSLMRKLDGPSTEKNFIAAVKYLKTHPQSTGKVGCTGFCWGGGMTNQVAVNAPDLRAGAPFYGRQPASEDVKKIKASMFCHYASNDRRINAGIEAFEAALKEASIDYGMYLYQGASHAFFNDSNPDRYHKPSAELAWRLTIAFFDSTLKKE